MTQTPPSSTAALWARFRFSVVGSLLSSPPARGALQAAIRSLAQKTWAHPVTGRDVRVAAGTIAGGTAFLDSALTTGFGGSVLAAIASTGARNPLNASLRRGPLAFYGRISYGMYMTHIMVFICFGWFDRRMDGYGTAGNLAVVAFRIVASTAVATALWYGFESRILRLKRYF